jgi:hypothetical protein
VFILADNVGYGDLGPYGGGELRGMPTPRIDQLAAEGLRLTQFLVEPACTPSRAALMTGQYSIRNGLSLIIIADSPNTLSAHAYTMGDMFHGLGYTTAIFGKWHLGGEPQSLPTAHGFDEFYGIPPDISWDSATYVDSGHSRHEQSWLKADRPFSKTARLSDNRLQTIVSRRLKLTGMSSRVRVCPAASLSMTASHWSSAGPNGSTMRPPALSCSRSAAGVRSPAAVTRILSYGACSAHPREPSPMRRPTVE